MKNILVLIRDHLNTGRLVRRPVSKNERVTAEFTLSLVDIPDEGLVAPEIIRIDRPYRLTRRVVKDTFAKFLKHLA